MRGGRGALAALLLACCLPLPALAEAPTTSPRPLLRPVSATPEAAPAPEAGMLPSDPALAGFRPPMRPATLAVAPVPPEAAAPEAPPGGVLLAAIRPLPRPERGAPQAVEPVAVAPGKRSKAQKTAPAPAGICGLRGVTGRKIAAIPGKVRGCGLEDGVEVTSVSGYALSQPITADCETVAAFQRWLERGIVPAVGKRGGGIRRVEIAASYSCRPRNNVRGAKISEHGRGRAVDFAGVTLKNGEVIDVLSGWKRQPKILTSIHRSACGTFGTVPGPKSDRYHQNHIHVDVARYRGGPYCR
ncbi:MAG: extensin family protein [Paenirhodobacter sp.]|uniref:extensin-like domain-containing protein n=1 Tax=Paenirhodobacter sp. TaxID=1965326 RepID=UPI003D15175F